MCPCSRMLALLFLSFLTPLAYASSSIHQDLPLLRKEYITAMEMNDHQALDYILPLAYKAGVLEFEEDMMKFRPGIVYALQNSCYAKFIKSKLSQGQRGRLESLISFQWRMAKYEFPLLHQIHQGLLVAFPYVIYLLEPKLDLYKYKQSKELFFGHSLQVVFYRYLYDNVITDRSPDVKGSWRSLNLFGDLLLKPEFLASYDSVELFCKSLFDNRAKTTPSVRFALALYGYLDLADMKTLYAMAIENKEYFTATAALKSLHAKYQVQLEDNETVKYGPPVAKLDHKNYVKCKKNAKIDNEPDLQVDLTANNADQTLLRITEDTQFFHSLVHSLPEVLKNGGHPELVKIMMENFDIRAKDILSCRGLAPFLHILGPYFPVQDLISAQTAGSENLIVFIAMLYCSQDLILIQAANRFLPYLGQSNQLLILLRSKKIAKLLESNTNVEP